VAKKKPAGAAWTPPDYADADAFALQALQRGEANPDQQVRALKYVVETICGTYDLSFRPESERETCFAEGRRFCGTQIVKLCNIKIRTSHGRRDPNRDPERSPADEQRPDQR
jgi:hypothetical protein